MVLLEERSLKAYRECVFPVWKRRLENYLGFPLCIDVEWTSLLRPDMSIWCFQHLTEVYSIYAGTREKPQTRRSVVERSTSTANLRPANRV